MPDPTAPDSATEAASPSADREPDPAADCDPQPTARQRLYESVVHPTPLQVMVGLVLFLVGFGAVTQVRANELDNTYAGYRQQDLIDLMSAIADASRRAESEIAVLKSTRRDLLGTSGRRAAARSATQKEIDTLSILAGQVPVTGPGIRVTIEETSGTADIDSLLDAVEELRTAGAESIEFNDEVRVVAGTSFAVGDGGALVGGTLLTSPYVIEAIGAPDTLAGGLQMAGGPVDQLEEDGASVSIEQLDQITIAATQPSVVPEYAEPDDGQ